MKDISSMEAWNGWLNGAVLDQLKTDWFYDIDHTGLVALLISDRLLPKAGCKLKHGKLVYQFNQEI